VRREDNGGGQAKQFKSGIDRRRVKEASNSSEGTKGNLAKHTHQKMQGAIARGRGQEASQEEARAKRRVASDSR
jgi:hypothetical protein